MSEQQPSVFVVDDDASVRDALSNLIRSVGLNVSAFASAHEFLAARIRGAWGCLVLDVRLPGQSGLDLQHALCEAGDEIPIIFITGHGDIPMSVRAMKAGAVEFLPKPFREQDLLDAIWSCIDRAGSDRERRAELESITRRVQDLTAREREVLTRLLLGRLNKQVATELGISEVTVKIHRRHIMEKMAVSSLVELARMIGKLPMDHPIYT